MAPPPADQGVLSEGPSRVLGFATLPSLPEAHRSIAVPAGGRFWKKAAAFAGPGYLVAVGYMDPGNWATDLAGGSRFGYALLSVVLVSSFAAMFLQWLALRLGIASGRDLSQLCRERFGKRVAVFLWLGCEVAIAACDLAEVIGTAIALKLLFHMPMLLGVSLTVVDTLVILGLQKRGFRYMEALVIVLMGTICTCLGVEFIFCRPDLASMLAGFTPTKQLIEDPAMLYIALGIFGATVMPHNLYLHSSIAQTRSFDLTASGRHEAIRFSTLDCFAALGLALFVNAAILVLAAAAFHRGHPEIAQIEDAYKLLSPVLGVGVASALFAAALLASGQNSTLTGTLAGQIVMEGFLHFRMNPAARRLLTRAIAVVPTLFVIVVLGESAANNLLILSQVVLSLQLGFAVVPLVMFTSNREIMGEFVNSKWIASAGCALAAFILGVNGWLVVQTFTH